MPNLETLINLVAPFDCVSCGAEGSILCEECTFITRPRRPTCYLCNALTDEFKTCASCRRKTKLRSVFVASRYEKEVKVLIHDLKFARARAGGKALAALLDSTLPRRKFDVVTSVPSATSRYRSRGYNPAELIAKEYARRANLKYDQLLGRLGQSRQVGVGRKQRQKQIRGVFYPLSKKPSGLNVLIIDDVISTGSTLSEAALVLSRAGAKSIHGAVIAKH